MPASPFQELTLVVATRNRPVLLKRLLDYWDNTMEPLTIIVADSSEAEHLEANRKTCAEMKRHKSIHHDYPTDMPFVEKVVKGVELVTTPFMALCADDDFLLARPLEEALNLLRRDPSVACVQGLEIFFRPANTVGFDDRMLLDIHCGISIDEEAAAKRLCTHLGKYKPSIYGIRRTPEFLADVSSIVPLQNQYMLMELAFASLDAVRGKVIRLPHVATMRESHAEVAFRKHSDVTYWENVIFSPQFSQWLDVYLTIVATRLEEFSELKGEEARNAVRDSLRAFSLWHFGAMDRAGKTGGSLLSRLRAAFFKVPVVGALAKKLWLKAAKGYDGYRIQKRYGAALRSADYEALIKHLESYFGYKPGMSIVR